MARNSPQSQDFFSSLVSEGRVRAYLDRLRNHHPETCGHSLRVGLLCVDLGVEEVLEEPELRLLGYGGLLHDVGKLRVPKRILEKNAALDPPELAVMSQHPRLGFLELAEPEYEPVKKIVVAHHEYKRQPYPRSGADRRAKVRGRPRRFEEDRIGLYAQIVAVCDIYDALASPRAYKPPMGPSAIERALRDQFTGDPQYIDEVLRRHD